MLDSAGSRAVYPAGGAPSGKCNANVRFRPIAVISGGCDSLLMASLMLGALAAFASTGPVDAPEFVKPEIAASRVAACGFKNVQPAFDDTLQEDVIKVLDVTVATEEQLTCVANASLGSHYYVVFPGPVDQTYQPLYWRISRERGKADARAWLEQRGLLSRLPTFDPKQSETTAFARALEGLCGPKAAGTLKPMKGFATFSDEAFSGGRLDDETLLCLLNVSEASGYPLGFIGNEAYPQGR